MDRNLLVFGVRLAAQIKIRGEMNHRGDTVAIGSANAFKRCRNAFLRGQVNAYAFGFRRGVWRCFPVQSDEGKPTCQLANNGGANKPAAARDDNNILAATHPCPPGRGSLPGFNPSDV